MMLRCANKTSEVTIGVLLAELVHRACLHVSYTQASHCIPVQEAIACRVRVSQRPPVAMASSVALHDSVS